MGASVGRMTNFDSMRRGKDMKLYDEVYDEDAYIKGVIIQEPDEREACYFVLWANGVLGRVDGDDRSISPTGRSLAEDFECIFEKMAVNIFDGFKTVRRSGRDVRSGDRQDKTKFFDAVGKINIDRDAVEELRSSSMV